MCKPSRTVFRGSVAVVASFVLLAVLAKAQAQPPADAAATAEPAPPAGQTYAGAKECASCHFKQFMTWKKTKHSKNFDLLTAKHETDTTCLKCHSTGYGQPTGFKSKAATPSLTGTTCEACHGPGSTHAATCKAFGKEKLNAEQEKQARDSIWKVRPGNICVRCHVVQTHGESPTPADMRTK